MREETLSELERLLTEMLAWAETRGEELYQLHAEVARLRQFMSCVPEWTRRGWTGCGWDWVCQWCNRSQIEGHASSCPYLIATIRESTE